jgi:hypothetical protein
MQTKNCITLGALTLLFLGLGTSVATAQTQVSGSGMNRYENGADGAIFFSHVAVNAWLDGDGVPQGTISWEGDHFFFPGPGNPPGGPPDTYIFDVIDLWFDGNTAWVIGEVIASVKGNANGGVYIFAFTDNGDSGDPDEIDFVPIDSGNISVR